MTVKIKNVVTMPMSADSETHAQARISSRDLVNVIDELRLHGTFLTSIIFSRPSGNSWMIKICLIIIISTSWRIPPSYIRPKKFGINSYKFIHI